MKRYITFILFFTLQISLWAMTGTELFLEGKSAFKDKLFSRSIESFTEFIEQNKSDSRIDQADYMIGVSYFYLKRFDSVETHFKEFETKYPKSVYLSRIHYWTGLSFYAQKKYQQAINEFEIQSGFDKELYFRQRSYQFLAYSYEALDQKEKAISSYETLMSLNPSRNLSAQILEREGILLMDLGLYQRAYTLFTTLSVEYQDQPKAIKDVIFYQGECLYQLKEYEQSISRFMTFLTLYSHSSNREKALFRLGTLYAMVQEQDKALEYMDLLVHDYPDSIYEKESHRVLAEGYMRLGDYKAARESLASLLGGESDPVELQKLQYTMAKTYPQNKDEALKWYLLSAKGLDPEIAADSLYQSGLIYEKKNESIRTIVLFEKLFNQFKTSEYRESAGEWMAAYYEKLDQQVPLKNHLDRMLEDYPLSQKVSLYLYLRGNLSYKEKNYSEALSFYQKVLDHNEASLKIQNESRYRIGYIYTMRKEFLRSQEYFKLIAETSDDLELKNRSLLSMGICFLNIKDFPQAIKSFSLLENQQKGAPWKEDGLFYLAQIYVDKREYEKAISLYKTLLAEGTKESLLSESYFQLGWIYMQKGEFLEAADSFSTLSSLYPKSLKASEANYRSGNAYSYLEQWEKAIECYNLSLKDLKSASLKEELLYQMAWAYFMIKDYNKAEEFLNRLVAEFPQSSLPPDALFRAAESLEAEGDSSRAIWVYSKIVEEYRNNPLGQTSLYRLIQLDPKRVSKLSRAFDYLSYYADSDRQESLLLYLAQEIGQSSLNDQEIKLYQKILDLDLTEREKTILELAYYKQKVDKEDIRKDLKRLSLQHNLRAIDQETLSLYEAKQSIFLGNFEEASPQLDPLLSSDFSQIGSQALYMKGVILNKKEDYKEAADTFLRVKYRYPDEKEAIGKALYQSAINYSQAKDFESANRVLEMLKEGYPEIRIDFKIENQEKEPIFEEGGQPEDLSPSSDLLPLLGES